MADLAKAFDGDLDRFVEALIERDIGDATTRKLQAVLNDPVKRAAFELELAIVMDMEIFVTTTYCTCWRGMVFVFSRRTISSKR